MKLLSLFSLAVLSYAFILPPHGDEIDSSADEKKVQEAVVKWADATFFSHSNYKFEDFYAFWTEDYEISYMRSHAYKDMLSELELDKANGKYKGTDEAYKKEHDELEAKYNQIQEQANTMTNRVEYFQIAFWSNIQTNDGITVYYELICRLDNDYKVYEAVINSSIGAKSDKTEIVYKKGVDHSMVKKKVANTNDGGSTPPKIDGPPGNQGNGSVGITTNVPVVEDAPPVEDDSKSSKKDKKKKKKKKDKK